MIQDNKDQEHQKQTTSAPAPKKPNETGTIQVEGHIRIFDPKSKEIFVEKRA